MSDKSGVWWIAAVIAIVVVVGGGYLFLRGGGGGGEETIATPVPTVEATPTPAPEPGIPEGVTLAESDVFVRQVVSQLSQRPEAITWLANEDLVRRFVASVNNIAHGKSPRAHLGFLRPRGRFRVIDRGDRIVTDPRSFSRYDVAVAVFTSLDTEGTVAAFRRLEPLFNEAFAEIARPGTSFRDTLGEAIAELLATPAVAADAGLQEKVVTYSYEDPELESLSDVQRHLLRMGPDNVVQVQTKLRELAAALGMPEGGSSGS